MLATTATRSPESSKPRWTSSTRTPCPWTLPLPELLLIHSLKQSQMHCHHQILSLSSMSMISIAWPQNWWTLSRTTTSLTSWSTLNRMKILVTEADQVCNWDQTRWTTWSRASTRTRTPTLVRSSNWSGPTILRWWKTCFHTTKAALYTITETNAIAISTASLGVINSQEENSSSWAGRLVFATSWTATSRRIARKFTLQAETKLRFVRRINIGPESKDNMALVLIRSVTSAASLTTISLRQDSSLFLMPTKMKMASSHSIKASTMAQVNGWEWMTTERLTSRALSVVTNKNSMWRLWTRSRASIKSWTTKEKNWPAAMMTMNF